MEEDVAIDDIPEETKDLLGMSEIFGTSDDVANIIAVPYEKIYNQWLQRNPSSKYACWATASHRTINAINVRDSGVELDRYEAWKEQLTDWQADVNAGSSMKSRIDYVTEKDLISWWYICRTPEEVHNAMGKWHYVWCGSKEIDWRETRKTWQAIYGWGSGHFFALHESDRLAKEFVRANSYGVDAYDEWYFYTERQDFDQLFTAIAFIDKKDTESEKKLQERLDAFIKERGYSVIRQVINWRRPDLTTVQKLKLWNDMITT